MVGSGPSGRARLISGKALGWIGGVASAVVVTVVSGIVLAYINPGGSAPNPDPTNAPSTQPLAEPSTEAGSPFTVNLTTVLADFCSKWLVDTPVGSLPLPTVARKDLGASPEEQAKWANDVGAITDNVEITLTMQGKSASSVILQKVEATVVSRGQPVASPNVYWLGEGCGSSVSPRRFRVDLDAPDPVLVPEPGFDEAGNEIPAVGFPLKIANNDPEVIIIKAETKTCDCRWRFTVYWTQEGKAGQTVIDHNGQPFRVATFSGQPGRYYANPNSGWTQVDWPLG